MLEDIFVAVGLEREAVQTAIRQETLVQAVLDDGAQVRAYGISGVPALVFVDKYLVSDAQPYDVLTLVVEQVAKEVE